MGERSISESEASFSFVIHKHYTSMPVSPSKKQNFSKSHCQKETVDSIAHVGHRSQNSGASTTSMGHYQESLGSARWIGDPEDGNSKTRVVPPLTPRRSISMKNPIYKFSTGDCSRNSVSSLARSNLGLDKEEMFREASLTDKCKLFNLVF